MARFIVRRLLAMIGVLFAVSVIVFVVFMILPKQNPAQTLAGTSGQLGHPEVASVCQDIARDARRGILAHSRIVQLQALIRR